MIRSRWAAAGAGAAVFVAASTLCIFLIDAVLRGGFGGWGSAAPFLAAVAAGPVAGVGAVAGTLLHRRVRSRPGSGAAAGALYGASTALLSAGVVVVFAAAVVAPGAFVRALRHGAEAALVALPGAVVVGGAAGALLGLLFREPHG